MRRHRRLFLASEEAVVNELIQDRRLAHAALPEHDHLTLHEILVLIVGLLGRLLRLLLLGVHLRTRAWSVHGLLLLVLGVELGVAGTHWH